MIKMKLSSSDDNLRTTKGGYVGEVGGLNKASFSLEAICPEGKLVYKIDQRLIGDRVSIRSNSVPNRLEAGKPVYQKEIVVEKRHGGELTIPGHNDLRIVVVDRNQLLLWQVGLVVQDHLAFLVRVCKSTARLFRESKEKGGRMIFLGKIRPELFGALCAQQVSFRNLGGIPSTKEIRRGNHNGGHKPAFGQDYGPVKWWDDVRQTGAVTVLDDGGKKVDVKIHWRVAPKQHDGRRYLSPGQMVCINEYKPTASGGFALEAESIEVGDVEETIAEPEALRPFAKMVSPEILAKLAQIFGPK